MVAKYIGILHVVGAVQAEGGKLQREVALTGIEHQGVGSHGTCHRLAAHTEAGEADDGPFAVLLQLVKADGNKAVLGAQQRFARSERHGADVCKKLVFRMQRGEEMGGVGCVGEARQGFFEHHPQVAGAVGEHAVGLVRRCAVGHAPGIETQVVVEEVS